jgi:hypothetical protein
VKITFLRGGEGDNKATYTDSAPTASLCTAHVSDFQRHFEFHVMMRGGLEGHSTRPCLEDTISG